MAVYHLTPPIRGGERHCLPSSQIGPVTQAIRAMRAAEIVTKNDTVSSLPPTETDTMSVLPRDPDSDRQRIRDLRRWLAERIESDIALLDLLDGNCDIEEDDPPGGNVCDEPHDAEEDGDDHEQCIDVRGFDGTGYTRGRA